MAKYSGVLGFSIPSFEHGVTKYTYVEKRVYGDILDNKRDLYNGQQVNEEVKISNSISVVVDPFTQRHLMDLKYATLYGVKWKIGGALVQYPRLLLTLGEVYNAYETGNSDNAGDGSGDN